jgi:hypothetical protein
MSSFSQDNRSSIVRGGGVLTLSVRQKQACGMCREFSPLRGKVKVWRYHQRRTLLLVYTPKLYFSIQQLQLIEIITCTDNPGGTYLVRWFNFPSTEALA